MKSTAHQLARRVRCSAEAATVPIEIAGRTFTPDASTAYVEFYLAHSFPVYLDVAAPGDTPDRTALHPQTLANSYRSLEGKVFNLGHLMRSYNPDLNPRDRIFGTVMAVEFPPAPEGGWRVQGDPERAPGIRAVAALHKAAEGAAAVIDTWKKGVTPFSNTQWTVSMEKESYLEDGGFLVKTESGGTGYYDVRNVLEDFIPSTPPDFAALGWTYVPYTLAPPALKACLKPGDQLGIAKNYSNCETLFLDGGLNGKVFFYGTGLVLVGKESAARVARIAASAGAVIPDADAAGAAVARALSELVEKLNP